MEKLLEVRWKSTRVGTPPLDGVELSSYLDELGHDWMVIKKPVNKLTKEFSFINFNKALKFVNLVGEYSDMRNHHPNIELSWGKATITIWTHRINGLSIMDFVYAASVEKLYLDNL